MKHKLQTVLVSHHRGLTDPVKLTATADHDVLRLRPRGD